MQTTRLLGMLSVALLVLSCLSGCVKAHHKNGAKWVDPQTAAAQAIELYDTNRNGKIDGAEFDATPALKYASAYMDRNGDKMLDQREIATQIQLWLEYGVQYSETTCTFTEHGDPLADTQATFTPEPFLGPNYAVATGPVKAGSCSPTSENNPDDVHGLRPGFYTVTFEKYPNEKWGIEISHYNEIASENRGKYELEIRK